MILNLLSPIIGLAVFLGLLGMLSAGFRWGRGDQGAKEGAEREGLGSAEGAIYALLGLLLALAFSGAAERFDRRRDQIVDEANAVGTAYLRVDLMPAQQQPQVREAFRRYVDARLAYFRALPDFEAGRAHDVDAVRLQQEIWAQAVAASRPPDGLPSPALLAPLNEMFDIATSRNASLYRHPPVAIFVFLIVLALMSAFLVGINMSAREKPSRLHMFAYAAGLASILCLIIDLEFPRVGMIQLDGADRFLADVRASMK